MFSPEKMREIAQTENVIFYKHDCPFCIASEKLMTELVARNILDSFSMYYLDEDFDNQLLTDLVKEFGWQPGSHQQYCSKPQIFVNGEFVGGNRELHKSKWNQGTDNSGKLEVKGEIKETPVFKNPMPL